MIAFKEFIRRSMDGPVMGEQDFSLRLSRQLRHVCAEYGVRFNPTEIICSDGTADAIFEAAVALLGQVGVYNMDTNRAILLTTEEIAATCRETPKQFVRGEGKDAVRVIARCHNSKVPPYFFHLPLASERYSGGKEAFLSDMITAHLPDKTALGNLARELKSWLGRVESKAETVGDTMWAIAVARWCRTVAEATGHPNMFVGNITAVTVPAILACFCGENVYRKHHSAISVHIMPELKLNFERLQLAFIAREMGVPRWLGIVSILGGYARNAEETAILCTATLLAVLCYSAADWASLALVDLEGYRSGRATLQAQSGVSRASERNIGMATTGLQTTRNGLGSAFSLYEKAALIIEQTCSGLSWSYLHPYHPGVDGKPKTDMDCELVTKVAQAVSGMERQQANELVEKIFKLYEGHWNHPDKGKPYSYYYDLRTLTPSRDLVELHRQVEEQLASLGVPLP